MEITGFEIGGKRVEFSPAPKAAALPPVMVEALRGFAPPSSSIFDSTREPEEEQSPEPMLPFIVSVVRRIDQRVLRHFEVMGTDPYSVAAEHKDVGAVGERVRVQAKHVWELERQMQREADEAQAAELQRVPGGGYLA